MMLSGFNKGYSLKGVFRPEFFVQIKQYNAKRFLSDLGAGIIVAVVALPLAIAFGIASGVSPERGLITSVIAGFLISFLGGTRVQIGGPTGAYIVIVYGLVEQFGITGLVVATLMAGIMLVAMGLLRMGSIIQFMPYPIVIGFTSGIALIIFTSQVKDFLGLSTEEQVPVDVVSRWGYYIEHLSDLNLWAAGIGLFTIALAAGLPKLGSRIPGSLAAILLTTLAVSLLGIPVATIGSKFGQISGGIPAPAFPPVSFELIRALLVPAFTIAMLGAIESLLSAMVSDGVTGYRHRPNTELIALGIANSASSVFGGMPASGAIARTMTNIRNGGKTPMAGIIHALVLLAVMLFFGRLAALVPLATLAGILFVVSYNMSEWRSFRGIFRHSRSDIAVLLVTFLLTILIDLSVAIQFGLLLAVFLFVRRVSETTDIEVLRRHVEDERSHISEEEETLQIPQGVEVFQIKGPFFFGIANKFEEAERQEGHKPRVRILRMRRVPFIDSTGLKNLKLFIERCHKQKIEVVLSGLLPNVLKALEHEGIVDMVGRCHVTTDIQKALKRAAQLMADHGEANQQ